MSETEAYEVLQKRLQKMEQHVQEQDTEIYRLSKRVDKLVNALQVQKMQMEALAQGGAGGGDTMPADEKPPHY
ncbi:MAG: SlyX family protein [Opitutaceae bacterium]